MRGSDFVDAVRRELRKGHGHGLTERQIADYLVMSMMGLHNWKQSESISLRQMVSLVERVRRKEANRPRPQIIRTVVEFCEIEAVDTKQGAGREVFSVQGSLYREGLRNELEKHKGVYVFYDSRGRALYVGRTIKLTLWRELNNAFNRPRDSVQKIRRVDHPARNQVYRKAEEKSRPIRERPVPLSELARYFSAYGVAEEAIKDVEALLIRGFPNDLLNIRMENLSKEQPEAP